MNPYSVNNFPQIGYNPALTSGLQSTFDMINNVNSAASKQGMPGVQFGTPTPNSSLNGGSPSDVNDASFAGYQAPPTPSNRPGTLTYPTPGAGQQGVINAWSAGVYQKGNQDYNTNNVQANYDVALNNWKLNGSQGAQPVPGDNVWGHPGYRSVDYNQILSGLPLNDATPNSPATFGGGAQTPQAPSINGGAPSQGGGSQNPYHPTTPNPYAPPPGLGGGGQQPPNYAFNPPPMGGGGFNPGGSQPPSGQPGGVPQMPSGGFPFPWQPPGQQNSPYPGNGQPPVQNWTPPWQNMGGGPPIQGGGGYGHPDNFLADQGNDIGYLRGITEGAGYATDATPAWEAMKAAQQRNIQLHGADLAEKFNVSGNRFGSAFGQGMGDYYNQAAKDQNATLANMTYQSQESARQRELQAAGQLGGMATQGQQQLSSQDYGSRQQQMQMALQAAMQASGGADQAGMAQAGYGAQGAQSLLNTSMQGAGALYGGENQAAQSMFGQQGQMLPQMMQYDQMLRQMGLTGANDLSGQWNQGLQLGSQLGQQQYSIDENNLNRMYSEYLRRDPTYNPMLPYLFSAATAQPTQYFPQFRPSAFNQLASGIGAIGQGVGAVMAPGIAAAMGKP